MSNINTAFQETALEIKTFLNSFVKLDRYDLEDFYLKHSTLLNVLSEEQEELKFYFTSEEIDDYVNKIDKIREEIDTYLKEEAPTKSVYLYTHPSTGEYVTGNEYSSDEDQELSSFQQELESFQFMLEDFSSIVYDMEYEKEFPEDAKRMMEEIENHSQKCKNILEVNNQILDWLKS